jgi:hypothetical protein
VVVAVAAAVGEINSSTELLQLELLMFIAAMGL